MASEPRRLWGRQAPFERAHFQRTLALLGLSSVFGVTLILLVDADVTGLFGLLLVGCGLVCAMAAVSRARYDRETREGFAILGTRGGGFVLGSAAAFVLVAAMVVLLVLDGA